MFLRSSSGDFLRVRESITNFSLLARTTQFLVFRVWTRFRPGKYFRHDLHSEVFFVDGFFKNICLLFSWQHSLLLRTITIMGIRWAGCFLRWNSTPICISRRPHVSLRSSILDLQLFFHFHSSTASSSCIQTHSLS